MSTPTVDEILAQHGDDAATVKLIRAIFACIPGSPDLPAYGSVDAAAAAAGAPAAAIAQAHVVVATPAFRQAMQVADAIDTSDVGISVYSGLRTALTFFFGDRSKAMETDPQQGADAALKALGIAWLTHVLFPGTVPDKVRALRALPAGQALLTWYAAVEIALPFADDAARGVGSMVGSLVQKYGGQNVARFEAFAGAGTSGAAQGMLAGLTGPIDQIVTSAAGRASSIAQAAQSWLPAALATTDRVAGAVATAADAMPVYRYLVARLVAEAAVAQARQGAT